MKTFAIALPISAAAPSGPHPFLARLPAHVRIPFDETVAAITWADVRDFVLAYCACFLAVTTYFA